MLLRCGAGVVVGSSGSVVLPVEPKVYVQVAGLVVGVLVQIALYAALEVGRRLCQAAFAHRLMHRGVSHRAMITAWSSIYSNNLRGIEDIHLGAGPITTLLITLYLAETIAIGSIGSFYDAVPYAHVKATGPMPSWGPRQVPVTSQYDAAQAIDAAQTALLNFGLLYNSLTSDALLVNNVSGCAVAERGTGCGSAAILASPITVIDLDGDATNLSWVEPAAKDTFRGTFSTVGVEATCGPADGIRVQVQENCTIELMTPDGFYVSNAVLPYTAQDDFFLTPNVHVMTLGHGDSQYEPYIDADSRMWVAVMAFNFAGPFTDMTSLWVDYADKPGGRNVSVALCKLQVNVGRSDATVVVNYTEPTRISSILAASAPAASEVFDMHNATHGYRGGSSGYGVAQFLFHALQEMNCVVLPCSINPNQPPLWNMITQFVEGSIDGSSWHVDLDNNLPVIARAISKLCTLFLSAYVDASTIYDPVTASPPTTVTTPTERASILTNTACNAILLIGASCAFAMIALQAVGLAWNDGLAWYLSPPALWLTESVYTLLRSMQHVRMMEEEDEEEAELEAERDGLGRGSAPSRMRYGAGKRVMIGSVDDKGDIRLRIKREERTTKSLAAEGGGAP
ncbi:hypothetical protein HKX48_000219 [Thoreauomyces humboldtii]|nr:hypothetical protein HKX48_000219 [Thoreauomyces humboldtii]